VGGRRLRGGLLGFAHARRCMLVQVRVQDPHHDLGAARLRPAGLLDSRGHLLLCLLLLLLLG